LTVYLWTVATASSSHYISSHFKESYFFNFFLLLLFYWGYNVTLTKPPIIYCIELILPITFLCRPSLRLQNSSNRYNFPSTYMCTYYFHRIHYAMLFSFVPSPPTGINPPNPRQDLSCFLFSICILKKWHFCLFKIAIQGISLWHFHVHMNFNPSWFIPFIFLCSASGPFLWFQQV
jgi:hypothetical protein